LGPSANRYNQATHQVMLSLKEYYIWRTIISFHF
jgi:hypothetical protein